MPSKAASALAHTYSPHVQQIDMVRTIVPGGAQCTKRPSLLKWLGGYVGMMLHPDCRDYGACLLSLQSGEHPKVRSVQVWRKSALRRTRHTLASAQLFRPHRSVALRHVRRCAAFRVCSRWGHPDA